MLNSNLNKEKISKKIENLINKELNEININIKNKINFFDIFLTYFDNINNEYYLLINKIEFYYFIIFSPFKLEKNRIKKIKINFEDKNFMIKNFIINKNSTNLNIIFYNKNEISTISNLNFQNDNIILKTKKFNFEIISIKFSYFEDFYGILFNKKFSYFNIKNNDLALKEIINENYIDFNFVPIQNKFNSFNQFSLIFMNNSGEFILFNPLFPNYFSIKNESIFNNMFIENENYFDNQNDKILNNKLIEELKKCLKENNMIEINEYIKNIKINYKELIIFNKNSEVLNENIKYYKFFILENNVYPYIILRINNIYIDLLIYSSNILPQRKNEKKYNNDFFYDLFLLESFKLNQNIFMNENNINFFYKDILLNNEIIININNNVFLLNIPYLDIFTNIINKNENLSDETIYNEIIMTNNFNSKIEQINKFNKQLNNLLVTNYLIYNHFCIYYYDNRVNLILYEVNLNNFKNRNNNNIDYEIQMINEQYNLEKNNKINNYKNYFFDNINEKYKNYFLSLEKNNNKINEINLKEQINFETFKENEIKIITEIKNNQNLLEKDIKNNISFYELKLNYLKYFYDNLNNILEEIDNKKNILTNNQKKINQLKENNNNKFKIINEKIENIKNKIIKLNNVKNFHQNNLATKDIKNILSNKLQFIKSNLNELNKNNELYNNIPNINNTLNLIKDLNINKNSIEKTNLENLIKLKKSIYKMKEFLK